jgi:hypothetical protein
MNLTNITKVSVCGSEASRFAWGYNETWGCFSKVKRPEREAETASLSDDKVSNE